MSARRSICDASAAVGRGVVRLHAGSHAQGLECLGVRAVGRAPESGADLMSHPTLSRLENLADWRALTRIGFGQIDLYCKSFARPPSRIVLDIDDTDDPMHGQQELALFSAHYDCTCFQPIHIFDGLSGKPVLSLLRPGKRPSGKEVAKVLRHVIGRIRPSRSLTPDAVVRGPTWQGPGGGPTTRLSLGGEVSLAFDNMPTALPQVQAGKLRALGVTSPARIRELPDVPAMVELIPEFTVQSWQGLFAPAGTPQAIVDRLAEHVQAVLRPPDVVERIKGMGAQPGTVAGPQFTAFVRGETERWAEVVKASGAKAE